MIGLEWNPTGKTRGTYFPPQWGDISRLTSGHPGQRPCLHAEVPAFAESLRAGRRCGTQAWPSAAGVNYPGLTSGVFKKLPKNI